MNPAKPSLDRAYWEADLDLRVRHAKVGCILALVLVPAGAGLDYFVYPDKLLSLVGIRLLCDLAVGAVYALLHIPWGRRHVRALGVAWALFPGLAISSMIAITEGLSSPYYAGLNLVMIAVCLLMPWTLGEVLTTSGLTLGMYLIACLVNGPVQVSSSVLFNNVYFITLTAIICGTASFFTSRRRFEEFRLRHELDLSSRELEASYRGLEELGRVKSQFFANVSHELRTPLTLILSPLDEVLNQSPAPPSELRPVLELVRDNGLRLLKLINDLLEIVRLDEAGPSPVREAVDLASLIPGLADSLRHLARSKEQDLDCPSPASPLVVEGDPSRLEKIFLNLLTNALKFTPARGRIRVRLREEGGQAVVDVEDNGPGIDPKDQERIFERFQQADGSSTRPYQGIGLGLALARELVQEHGGALTVDSRPGHGSRFSVRLPSSGRPASSGPEKGSARAAEPVARLFQEADRRGSGPSGSQEPLFTRAKPQPGQGPRLLVVDDEPAMRAFLVSILGRDYRTLEAGDGPAGLDLAARERPDLVLLDLMLPGMDGLEVCRRLKSLPGLEGTPVVLLTARMDEAAKLQALENGADDFLTKPFSSTEIRVRISNILKLRAAEARLVQSEKMRALGGLAAGLLHEINNPLNFALTALHVARQQAQTDPSRLPETLQDIEEGMARISRLISDLRTFAQPDRKFQDEDFPLCEALEQARRFASGELEGLSLDDRISPDLRVRGSKGQLCQVFLNLLLNAAQSLKASPSRPHPGITVLAGEEPGEFVRVRILDNGPGVPQELLPRLMEPFFTTREPGQGLGLGLTVCHSLVRAQGGSMVLQNIPGGGFEAAFDVRRAGPKENL